MSNVNTAQNPLGTQPVWRLLLKFAVPSVISMLVASLYNIVDQIFIGHSPAGYLGNAATTVTFPLVTVMLALSLLIGNGAAAYISLQMGKGETAVVKKVLGNAFALAVGVGAVIAVVSTIFLKPLLRLFGATDAVMPYAVEYASVIVLGAPFALISSSMANPIRADGSPRYSMASSLVGAILNTILDPIFIYVFGMGVRGAALATVLSQMASGAVVMYYLLRMARHIRLEPKYLRLAPAVAGRLLAYGSSSFVTQISNTIINVTMNNSLVYYGKLSPYGSDVPLSAMGVVMKINAILISLIVGTAIGAQPILGFNYGAGNYSRVRRAYLTEISVTASLSAILCILFITIPGVFIRVFGSSSPEFVEFGSRALRTFLCCAFATGIQIPSANYFQAVGKPLKAMTLTLTRQIFLLWTAMMILPLFFGLAGVLYAGPVADVAALLVTGPFILREMRRLGAADGGRTQASLSVADTAKELFARYREQVMYLVFGVLTTIVNYVLYLLCGRVFPEGVWRIGAANLVAWVLSVLFAYVTNRRFVFRSGSTGGAAAREVVSFVAARAFSLVLDMGVLYMAVYLFGWYDWVSKIIANVVVVIANYIFSKLFIFRKAGDHTGQQSE